MVNANELLFLCHFGKRASIESIEQNKDYERMLTTKDDSRLKLTTSILAKDDSRLKLETKQIKEKILDYQLNFTKRDLDGTINC
ncbi:8107_t:CDS:2, partial [Racocetra fulgida]